MILLPPRWCKDIVEVDVSHPSPGEVATGGLLMCGNEIKDLGIARG
jgi:hypothetical protein